MPRYIDADALLKAMDTWDKFGFNHSGGFVREPETDDFVPYVHYDDMVKCVEGMPTADVVARKRGKWINVFVDGLGFNGLEFECSECGKRSAGRTNYCAYCGAEMVRRE